ncbi:MAG TPA: PHB depolymerase family esterase, partial [Trueperaceae bacterium]|nr:PHB depolymerase family esterase [Trueperaceae bacterium]
MPQTEQIFTARLQLDVSLRYLLYLPDDYQERSDWPLIVFLHGSGERGDDLALVRNHGLPRLLGDGLTLPAVVLSPQCPAGQLWTRQLSAVRALIERVATDHSVDRDRFVVTGLSLGGAGAYELASAFPG